MRYFLLFTILLFLAQFRIESLSYAADTRAKNIEKPSLNAGDMRSLAGEFADVQGGCFQMGDTFGVGKDNEKPMHEVCVSGFSIGKHEVTQGLWKRVMGNNPSFYDTCGDNCPVEQVGWKEIRQFIQQLNSLTGANFRLPTEAEWEYAARSGGKNEKYSGGDDVGAVAWYENNSGRKTHPVGQKQPNGLGIYDMSGNVSECVSDWYDKNYYSVSAKSDPQGPAAGSSHVLRGGNWFGEAADVRATERRGVSPDYLRSIMGFRLAFSAAPAGKTDAPVKNETGKPSEAAVTNSATEGELVTVPGGCFLANGKQVCLESFQIGKYEVTQGQYKRVIGINPSKFDECGDDCPVENVSWLDAKAFIDRLNSQTGKHYRLPTEAEWEYACRSGGKTEKYCGSDNANDVAWYDENSGRRLHRVGTKKPNGFGIFDMSGNVNEWVSDWHGDKYPSGGENPTGPPSGHGRVMRGGDYDRPAISGMAWGTTITYGRDAYPAEIGSAGIGFRLAAPTR